MCLRRGLAAFVFVLVLDVSGASNVLYMHKPTILPGSPRHADPDDPEVQKAAIFAVYEYNNRTNDAFLFKVSKIRKALIQVVKGMKFMLNAEIGRTVCRKRNAYDLENCDFQKEKNLQQAEKPRPYAFVRPKIYQCKVTECPSPQYKGNIPRYVCRRVVQAGLPLMA